MNRLVLTQQFLRYTCALTFISFSVNIGFCQTKPNFGIVVGSGLPKLSVSYTDPTWTLGGVSLRRPLNVGLYGEWPVSPKFKVGLDLTYYRLPLRLNNSAGELVFKETFDYLNIGPYISYEPIKWFSVSFNLSLRPLLSSRTVVLGPTGGVLTYYGGRVTVKPLKRIGIDLGLETSTKPFAIANMGAYSALFSNSMVYSNIRFALFTK